MENKKRMIKQLSLDRGYTKNGQEKYYGVVELKLRKNYKGELIVPRNMVSNNREYTVCNVTGVLFMHELHKKMIQNAFGVELPLDSFLNVDVSIWDGRLTKFNLSENSRFRFDLRNVQLDTFEKKDGTTGYKLVCTAYDFAPLYSGGNTQKNEGGQVNSEDKDAVEESDLYDDGDLPF